MRLLSVDIENILSIEKATIKFEESGLVLIEGWNYDAQRANGAGKSAILNAIAFALYDKVPRKITATEILRRGSKTGSVCIRVAAGNGEYSVCRSRPKGVSFLRDGSPIDITQQEWEGIIKLSYEQFLVSMYSAQGTESKFLSLNDSSKKDFLLKLLNLEDFHACKKLSDIKINGVELDIVALKNTLSGVTSKLEAYSETTSDGYGGNIEELQESIHALHNIKEPDLSKFKKVENDIEAKKRTFMKARTERSFYHTQYRNISSKVKPFDGSDICDSCGSKIDISQAQVHHELETDNIKIQMQDMKLLIDECDIVLQGEKAVEDLHTKLKEKLSLESKEYNAATKRITELKSLIREREAKKEIFAKIEVLKLQEAKLSSIIVSKNHIIEFYSTVASMCSPTGAQAYILDSIIDSFNEHVSEYVSLVWPNASYKLIAYRENKQGDITARFSDQLSMDGIDVSIGSLSGGECKALSLCADFAILDIMKSQFGLDLNPIILDEPFDGLDAVGKEIVIDLLDKLSHDRQIVIIDHSSEVATRFNSVIRVEKRNGVSTVCKTT
jgi:DNA repair exonuclease SbcCD ATPase subunit